MASTSAYTNNAPLINALSLVVIIMCCATNLAHTAMAGGGGGRREASAVVAAGGGGDDDGAMRARYERWVAKHGRTYLDDAEKARRYQVFRSNAEFVDSYNAAAAAAAAGKSSRSRPRLATNRFADLTVEEFEARYLINNVGRIISKRFNGSIPGFMYGSLSESDVPASRNWTAMGAVTPVKNQDQTKQCASCWAFSAVAAVEGIHAIKTGNLVSLSEQQLMDCSTGRKNRGCNKGDMEEAFLYIAGKDGRRRNHGRHSGRSGVVPSAVFWNGGLSQESAYPYIGVQSNCSLLGKPAAAAIRGFQYVPANNETALRLAVSQQPVSVALDGKNKEFQLYESGIFGAPAAATGGSFRCRNSSLNHAVTAVGYGTDEHGTRYWLMKNSWGTGWGEGGYVRIARDLATDAAGVCGLAVQASYPVA